MYNNIIIIIIIQDKYTNFSKEKGYINIMNIIKERNIYNV